MENCLSPRREEIDTTHECLRKDLSIDSYAFSPDDTASPRQTPKLRRSLLAKNQDIIDLYRQSPDLSESIHSERRASLAPMISKDSQLAQDREARTLAEHQLEICKKELTAAEVRLQSLQEMYKKETTDSENRFSKQKEEIEGLLKKQVDSDKQLDSCLQELQKLKEKLSSGEDGKAGKKIVAKLKKKLEEKDRYIDSLVQRMDSAAVLEATAGLGTDRQSLEILATLSEDEDIDEEEACTPVAESEEKTAGLKKLLAAAQQECEELRQTADRCWVREQAATKRAQDLERENQGLSDFTDSMKTNNGRILEGLREMQVRDYVK